MPLSVLVAVILTGVLATISSVTFFTGGSLTLLTVTAIATICIGTYMLIQGTRGKIHRKSPVTIGGSINRKEFYGALVTLFGIMQISLANITGRIDLLYQLISQSPK